MNSTKKKITKRQIKDVRQITPYCRGGQDREGMLLVSRILRPSDADDAAAALFKLINLIGGIDDQAERINVVFFCVMQSVLFFDEPQDLIKEINDAFLTKGLI